MERARASEDSARAGIKQACATLSTDETNLSKASIRSPIDGVVLSRSVEPGNAVAASLQAVTLFTLAEDLAKMKLQVNVDEADVVHREEGDRHRVRRWWRWRRRGRSLRLAWRVWRRWGRTKRGRWLRIWNSGKFGRQCH